MKDNSLNPDWDSAPDARVGPGSPLTHTEWKTNLGMLRMHAQAMQQLLNDLARKISADAGLDPNLLGLHPHNAMCSKDTNPWPEVDYNRCQVVLDLLDHEFDANRIVDAFDKATRLDPHSRWLEANREEELPLPTNDDAAITEHTTPTEKV